MGKHSWENLVAYVVWNCKLCGEKLDRDGVGMHMYKKHGIRSVEIFENKAYSEQFKYPEVIGGKG